MEWSWPNGKSRWCNGCHTVWRTMFQGRAYKTDLEDWLKYDPVKRTEFHMTRLAWLSLAFEGNVGSIQKSAVEARLHLLKWMSQVCCLCFDSHVVAPFEEAAAGDSPWHHFAALPGHLTTIHAEGAHRLGVCVCPHI